MSVNYLRHLLTLICANNLSHLMTISENNLRHLLTICKLLKTHNVLKRIVFLDFIHRLVSQEQTKLKIIDKR